MASVKFNEKHHEKYLFFRKSRMKNCQLTAILGLCLFYTSFGKKYLIKVEEVILRRKNNFHIILRFVKYFKGRVAIISMMGNFIERHFIHGTFHKIWTKCPIYKKSYSMKCPIYKNSYLWNVLSIKSLILWNVLSIKSPILWNVLSIKSPIYEMSYL